MSTAPLQNDLPGWHLYTEEPSPRWLGRVELHPELGLVIAATQKPDPQHPLQGLGVLGFPDE